MNTRVDISEEDWLRLQTHLQEEEAIRRRPWNRFKTRLAKIWDWLPVHSRMGKKIDWDEDEDD